MDIKETIGKRLKEIRLEMQVSQGQIAKELGVDYNELPFTPNHLGKLIKLIDNKTISGLFIYRPNVDYVGFFGYASNSGGSCNIKNLNFKRNDKSSDNKIIEDILWNDPSENIKDIRENSFFLKK